MIGDAYPQFYELVSKCLVIDPRERVSAAEALNLSFFTGANCCCLLHSAYSSRRGLPFHPPQIIVISHKQA